MMTRIPVTPRTQSGLDFARRVYPEIEQLGRLCGALEDDAKRAAQLMDPDFWKHIGENIAALSHEIDRVIARESLTYAETMSEDPYVTIPTQCLFFTKMLLERASYKLVQDPDTNDGAQVVCALLTAARDRFETTFASLTRNLYPVEKPFIN